MLMLKTIMSLQMFVTNKIFATNKISDIKDSDESIEKSRKLSKN